MIDIAHTVSQTVAPLPIPGQGPSGSPHGQGGNNGPPNSGGDKDYGGHGGKDDDHGKYGNEHGKHAQDGGKPHKGDHDQGRPHDGDHNDHGKEHGKHADNRDHGKHDDHRDHHHDRGDSDHGPKHAHNDDCQPCPPEHAPRPEPCHGPVAGDPCSNSGDQCDLHAVLAGMSNPTDLVDFAIGHLGSDVPVDLGQLDCFDCLPGHDAFA
jgi:hypothetical protein